MKRKVKSSIDDLDTNTVQSLSYYYLCLLYHIYILSIITYFSAIW